MENPGIIAKTPPADSRLQRDPPAEDYHRSAVNALNYGLGGVALCSIMIFILKRLLRMCFGEPALTMQASAGSALVPRALNQDRAPVPTVR